MLTPEDLSKLENDALTTLRLKMENAHKGHDWVVDSHSMSSTKLLELVAVAKLGLPVWMAKQKTGTARDYGKDACDIVCQNDACEWHGRGSHTHPDGTINSPPIWKSVW